MNAKPALATALLAALALGCHNNNQQRAAAPAQPPPDKFESMKDPPIQAQTFFAAGQLAESQGNNAEALLQYKKALEISPRYLDPLYRTGLVYTGQKDYKRAIETWNKYVTATGGSATAYNNLAFCQELAGNPTAAETAYRAGIAKDPANEPCRVNYGLMLARRGNVAEAIQQLQTVLPPAKAHYDLASVFETQGKTREAREEYRRAAELDPTFSDAKRKLASLVD